ncbi:glycosyltransferase family 4 protein [Flavobacterium sp.]|uniref:glycosyltransferase family 4 protein n=1 Tax=Flavobacterium sp. TaxID=239 RepID=UPI00121AAE15|nr:glycosyltransferase family 4 protein [Flavobacterium sp.]RZJ70872.1 MAG: glycosyltransferase [Flavobacterium sp.]
MQKKRILYIGNKLSKHGNTATSIETLGPLLASEGFVVKYASSKKNKIFRMIDMLAATLRYSLSTDYVIIDTYSTVNFWYAFGVSQICRIFNVSYIPVLRGGNLPERLAKSPKLCKMIFANSYKNIAPSGYLMDAFAKAGFDNLTYVPNTLEVDNYEFWPRTNLRPKLFWVRSFSPIYNPKMAIDVLKILKREFPDASLCMVGPDKNGFQSEIVSYARQNDVAVAFTGKLSKPQWHELSREYDIFINTTHYDNTPVSVIEAMALGLPVVSTNVGGIPFLLEHDKTALLVEDSDVEAMVANIVKLVSDQDVSQRLANQARSLVETFDWHKIKYKWVEILK